MQEDLYPRWFNNLPAKHRPDNYAQANPYIKLISWLAFLLLAFLFLNSLWTWFSLDILADESTIKSCLQEVAGPESSPDIADTANQIFIQEVATSALQSALFTFLLTIAFAFACLRISNK